MLQLGAEPAVPAALPAGARMGKDPALASGPVLTTITDMCGFFFALGLATVAMSKLAGV